MTVTLLVIILVAIALGFAGYEVISKRGASLLGWAVLALSAAILITRV